MSDHQDAPVQYSRDFTVRSYEVDPAGRLDLVSLTRMLQEVAWQHAKRLGWGLVDRDGGSYWVLSRLRLRIVDLPRWEETFTITTFPVGTDRLFANREFVISRDDNELARVHTGWLIVDSKTQRPVRPQKLIEGIVITPPQYQGSTEKIPEGTAGSRLGPYHVLFHDIDQYRHVNNTAYLEWMLDTLPMESLLASIPTEIQVDYLQETLIHDSYEVLSQHDGTSSAFEITRSRDQKPVCRARILWRA